MNLRRAGRQWQVWFERLDNAQVSKGIMDGLAKTTHFMNLDTCRKEIKRAHENNKMLFMHFFENTMRVVN